MAFCLGWAVDAMAGAPLGLHVIGLVVTAFMVRQVGGHLGGTGTAHFGLVTGFAQLCYHVALVALMAWQGYPIGFVSWPAALLLPAAGFTACLGMLSYGSLQALHRRLAPESRRGLQWR